jgi:cell wall-associated NlpC family hydrolase
MENHELIHDLNLAREVAMSLHGLPYRWGGDDPGTGFDCSGFCIEVLRSVGKLPRSGDWTAQGLYDMFKEKPRSGPHLGCLAFWWNSSQTRIIHIEFCIDNKHTIGASGGGSKTTSFEAASKSNAFIKVRPVRQNNLAGFLDPFR